MHSAVWIRFAWLLLALLVGCTTSSVEPIQVAGPTPTPLPPPLVNESTATSTGTSSVNTQKATDPSPSPTELSTSVHEAGGNPLATTGVSVDTDRSLYGPGESILITIRRDVGAVVYPTPGERGCPIITVQRLHGQSWEPVAVCPWSGPDMAQPGLQMKDLAWGFFLDAQGPAVGGAGTGESVAPEVFHGPLSDLPTVTPPPPGYSGPEVPRGPGRLDPDDRLPTTLEPDTYRIAFSFTASPDSDVTTAVYSDPFVISD